jgi:hypothetical protein
MEDEGEEDEGGWGGMALEMQGLFPQPPSQLG